MGNINKEQIRKKTFTGDEKYVKDCLLVEDYCIRMAVEHTDKIIEDYKKLGSSREGRYINSDLMKMVFPFYALNMNNRKKYNLSITNSAAVLTSECYKRAIQDPNVKRCIYLAGPYGAGKSYCAQSLFEVKNAIGEGCIVYEGSITLPAFGEKVEFAKANGVEPHILMLNPTLELSMSNIRERAKRIGRDVIKSEVVEKYADLYSNFQGILSEFPDISFTIYNKENNVPLDLTCGSQNVQDLYHGTREEVSEQYDRICKLLDSDTLELEF